MTTRCDASLCPGLTRQIMAAIRETLFAALAEVLGSSPELLARLQSSDIEKPRAFFASLALAVLLVATTRCDLSPPPRIRVLQFGPSSSTFAGMPSVLDVEHCPQHLRPLLQGLLGIAALARQAQDADDRAAMERAMRDEMDGQELTAIERLRQHFLFEEACRPTCSGSPMRSTRSRSASRARPISSRDSRCAGLSWARADGQARLRHARGLHAAGRAAGLVGGRVDGGVDSRCYRLLPFPTAPVTLSAVYCTSPWFAQARD